MARIYWRCPICRKPLEKVLKVNLMIRGRMEEFVLPEGVILLKCPEHGYYVPTDHKVKRVVPQEYLARIVRGMKVIAREIAGEEEGVEVRERISPTARRIARWTGMPEEAIRRVGREAISFEQWLRAVLKRDLWWFQNLDPYYRALIWRKYYQWLMGEEEEEEVEGAFPSFAEDVECGESLSLYDVMLDSLRKFKCISKDPEDALLLKFTTHLTDRDIWARIEEFACKQDRPVAVYLKKIAVVVDCNNGKVKVLRVNEIPSNVKKYPLRKFLE